MILMIEDILYVERSLSPWERLFVLSGKALYNCAYAIISRYG
jgi:hypothetical protein